jgi:ribosomal protein L11 methyltransferase
VTGPLTVEVTVAGPDVDLVADELWQLGATAVHFRPLDGSSTVLVAGFPTGEAARSVASRIRTGHPTKLVEIADDAWQHAWRQYAEPVHVGSMVVVPAWRPVEVGHRGLTVQIDPGPCFGSGSHASTRLLLGELERRVRPGARVLDVGTGSGILAVTAALLGAGSVTAVDIDPDAVAVTRANAAHNGVGDRIDVSTSDAGDVPGVFDLVLANLTAGTLAELAGPLASRVASGGTLLLGGLLPGQWPHVAARFAGLSLAAETELEGWSGIVLDRDRANP